MCLWSTDINNIKITGYQNKQNINTFNSNGEPQTDNSHAKQEQQTSPYTDYQRNIWRTRNMEKYVEKEKQNLQNKINKTQFGEERGREGQKSRLISAELAVPVHKSKA